MKKIDEYKDKLVKNIKNKYNSLFPGNGINLGNFTFLNKIKNMYNSICKFNYTKEFKINKEFPLLALPAFPYIQLKLIPYVYLGIDVKMDCKKKNNDNKGILSKYDFGIFLSASASLKVSINLEVGFYFPGISSTFEISISVGISGVLGEGTIGIKIDLYLFKKKVEIDLYFIFKAFEFSFYIQFKFKIELIIQTFKYSFYIINKKLFGLCYEKHNTKTYALS